MTEGRAGVCRDPGNGPGVVRRTININNAKTEDPGVYGTNFVFNYINSDFILCQGIFKLDNALWL